MSHDNRPAPSPRKARKAYQPPAVREEKVFERQALQSFCHDYGGCAPSDKLPS